MKCSRLLLFCVGICTIIGLAARLLEVPVLTVHATDFTNTLSLSQPQSLESRLPAFEDSTSVQIAVPLIPTLKGGNLENFCTHIAEKDKIDQAKKDSSITLLFANQNCLMPIEAGYGFEARLGRAKRYVSGPNGSVYTPTRLARTDNWKTDVCLL